MMMNSIIGLPQHTKWIYRWFTTYFPVFWFLKAQEIPSYLVFFNVRVTFSWWLWCSDSSQPSRSTIGHDVRHIYDSPGSVYGGPNPSWEGVLGFWGSKKTSQKVSGCLGIYFLFKDIHPRKTNMLHPKNRALEEDVPWKRWTSQVQNLSCQFLFVFFFGGEVVGFSEKKQHSFCSWNY